MTRTIGRPTPRDLIERRAEAEKKRLSLEARQKKLESDFLEQGKLEAELNMFSCLSPALSPLHYEDDATI